MSVSQKPKQPASRWAFLSQAVASVESGLDKILAEEEDTTKNVSPKQANPQPQPSTQPRQSMGSARPSTELSRSDSANKTNDRLQARLAQAMAKKAGSRATTPVPDPEVLSTPGTPGLETIQPASNKEQVEAKASNEDETFDDSIETKVNAVYGATETSNSDTSAVSTNEDAQTSTQPPIRSDKPVKHSSTKSNDIDRTTTSILRASNESSARQSMSESSSAADAKLLNVQLEHEKSLRELQEEINGYLERIDGLQRNVQTLTRETVQNAKHIKNDSEASPHTKQLAEKDERIALLMEEGTKLTKSEMQYRNMIKKLRAQATTLSKEQDAVRQRAEKAEKTNAALEAKALKAETEARKYREQIAGLSKSTSEAEAITKERNALAATLADIRAQLSNANKRAEDAESKAQSDKLIAERRKISELQLDLSSAKVERELAEDKLKREIEDLKQSLAHEKEQTRAMETEMLAEQAALESKLESFRVRAEEATAGDQSDSQGKLLRQIETLQSQYSAASQNWQGIESTLLGRITAIEKERAEVVGREADLRRKLRDATNKAKNASKELDEVQQSLAAVRDRQADDRIEAAKASRKAEKLEDELATIHKELEDQRLRAEKEMTRRLEEEKAKWIASMAISKVDSPAASLRKAPGGLFMDNLVTPNDRPSSRRSSTHPFRDPAMPPSGINSAISLRANGAIPETPSIIIGDDRDDFFAYMPATPASATHAGSGGRLNDVVSASTGGAGPSVQLVERMSANVRRLESEKAASKDELARLSSQRDEARQEVVNLMRELEQKRSAEERLAVLERNHLALTAKHQATLELLGEKTEQVEELKADILDVKQMYRQLADTMGK